MTKRICSLLLTLCLIFSLSTFAFATNGAHKTVDYIAQDWIDTQFSGDAEVSDTIVLRSDNSGEEDIVCLVAVHGAFLRMNTKPSAVLASHQI